MRRATAAKPTILLLLVLVPAARAENWPRWRGPDGNAVSGESPLPVQWNSKQNVRWKTKVPGEGFSSPIVWEDRVFVTSALEKGTRRIVHCLDRKSGKILWSSELAHKGPEVAWRMTGHAAPTPVTDGKRVVAFFGNAGVVCYDFAGKRLWHRDLGEFDSELGLASSPVLWRDRLLLVCDHDGDRFTSFDSFLIALNSETGKDVWKTERRDLKRSWSTPILAPGKDGRQELIVNAQDELRAYDPETGKPLWQVADLGGWVAPSPVFGHGRVFATSGKNGPVLAVKPGGKGEVKPDWRHAEGGPYVCSPVLYGDYLYVPDEQGFLACYHALSGKQQYRERLGGKFYASAVAGDGKLYLTNADGITFVVKAGPKLEVLAKNALEEYTLASLAVSAKELFLRTEHHLYCIGGE